MNPNPVVSSILDISEKIHSQGELILTHLEPFLEDTKHYSSLIRDFQTLKQGTLNLLDTLDKRISKTQLIKELTNKTLEPYLVSLRHDLLNPVNVIKGYTEIVYEDLVGGSEADSAQTILKIYPSIKRILELINVLKVDESNIYSKKSATPSLSAVKEEQESPEYRLYKEQFSILIVDDSPENCDIMERYLKRIGFKNVQSVLSGQEALALKDSFKLFLLDIAMPGLSGIDVLRDLREHLTQRRLSVLMVSAADTMDNIVDCIKLGADDFLPKPFNPDILRARLETCIERKWFIDQQQEYFEKLEHEKERFEKLLQEVFPQIILPEFVTTGKLKPAHYDNVALVLVELVDFGVNYKNSSAEEAFKVLQQAQALCEKAAEENKVKKIRTFGETFLGTCGLLSETDSPVKNCVNFAENLIMHAKTLNFKPGFRIAIHYGTVLGGLVGEKQFLFDLLGEEISFATSLQKSASPNKIYLSESAWKEIKEDCIKANPEMAYPQESKPISHYIFQGWNKEKK